jgi:hypothetical protein
MKPKFRWICPVLLLAMLAPGASAVAQPEDRGPDDLLASMMRQGWKPVAPGVLRRHQESGRVETFAIGPEGSRWAVREVENRLAFLKREYRAYPNDDLRRAIRSLRRELSRFREDLEASQDEPLSRAMEKCTANRGASADAYPLTSAAGVGATASAYFNGDCGYEAETYASAYARATANGNINTVIQESPRTGTNITSSATASVQGTSNCLSEAYSYARYSPANIFYSVFDSNTSCIAPLAISIDGPSEVGFDPFSPDCRDPVWYATASGGTPSYSYKWSVNGVQVGTGNSYSRTVCREDASFSLSLTVTDSTGQSVADSFTVWVVRWEM